MPLALTDKQARRIAAALRQGALDSLRIADAIDPAGRTHFTIEVSDMGQFAKDWEQLKTLIRQKDDAIDRQAAQLAALQKQLAAQPAPDADDQKALAELRQTASDNPPTATAAPPTGTASTAAPPTVTTFVK